MKKAVLIFLATLSVLGVSAFLIHRHNRLSEFVIEVVTSPENHSQIIISKQHLSLSGGPDVIRAELIRNDESIVKQEIYYDEYAYEFDDRCEEWRWIDEKLLRCGERLDFEKSQSAILKVRNETSEDLSLVRLLAGGEIYILLDLVPGDVREIRFPLSFDYDWIEAEYLYLGARTRGGENFSTDDGHRSWPVIEVELLRTEARIYSSDLHAF